MIVARQEEAIDDDVSPSDWLGRLKGKQAAERPGWPRNISWQWEIQVKEISTVSQGGSLGGEDCTAVG